MRARSFKRCDTLTLFSFRLSLTVLPVVVLTQLYATGHGGVVVRAKTSIEPVEQNGKKRGAAASSATPSSSTSKRMAIIVHEVSAGL